MWLLSHAWIKVKPCSNRGPWSVDSVWFCVLWWGYNMELLSALLTFCQVNSLVSAAGFPSRIVSDAELLFLLLLAGISSWTESQYTGAVRDELTHIWRHYYHDDVIKWKHFPRTSPFVRGIHWDRWIPHTKASDAELLCFRWSASE